MAFQINMHSDHAGSDGLRSWMHHAGYGFRSGNVRQPRRRANHQSMQTPRAVMPYGKYPQPLFSQIHRRLRGGIAS